MIFFLNIEQQNNQLIGCFTSNMLKKAPTYYILDILQNNLKVLLQFLPKK